MKRVRFRCRPLVALPDCLVPYSDESHNSLDVTDCSLEDERCSQIWASDNLSASWLKFVLIRVTPSVPNYKSFHESWKVKVFQV